MTKLKKIAKDIHKKHLEKHRQNQNSVEKIDKTMAVVGTFGPMMTLIQIIHIFSTKAVAGLSPITWFGYSVVSLCWVIYGFFYKDKPIMIVNSISTMTSMTVLIGYIIYN